MALRFINLGARVPCQVKPNIFNRLVIQSNSIVILYISLHY